jgi:hypothetical protein
MPPALHHEIGITLARIRARRILSAGSLPAVGPAIARASVAVLCGQYRAPRHSAGSLQEFCKMPAARYRQERPLHSRPDRPNASNNEEGEK